jgi:hypothetical protein
MKQEVGSGVGSGPYSQRYGSGVRIRIRTKMSRIPNTGSKVVTFKRGRHNVDNSGTPRRGLLSILQ